MTKPTKSKRLNIVIPMAGQGMRFVNSGFAKPKPFIDVAGLPMIIRVLRNLYYENANYILLSRKEHMETEIDLVNRIKKDFNVTFIPVDIQTEGTACTVLFARKYINNDQPLIIANSDQLVDVDISDFVADSERRELDGSILTFSETSRDPKWSFARVSCQGDVLEVREKIPISDYATAGIYLFGRGRNFVEAAIEMLIRRDRVNNEYYVCPTYNYLVSANKKVGIYNIARTSMHGLGTPEDLKEFLLASEFPG